MCVCVCVYIYIYIYMCIICTYTCIHIGTTQRSRRTALHFACIESHAVVAELLVAGTHLLMCVCVCVCVCV